MQLFQPHTLTYDCKNVLSGGKVNPLHLQVLEVGPSKYKELGDNGPGDGRSYTQRGFGDLQLNDLREVLVEEHLPSPTHWGGTECCVDSWSILMILWYYKGMG